MHFICSAKAKDQLDLEETFLSDKKVVFTDGFDSSKWFYCTINKCMYHLKCVTTTTEQKLNPKGGHLSSISISKSESKWVTYRGKTRSTKWNTYSELFLSPKIMNKKFSKKGKGEKVVKKRRGGQRLHQWWWGGGRSWWWAPELVDKQESGQEMSSRSGFVLIHLFTAPKEHRLNS